MFDGGLAMIALYVMLLAFFACFANYRSKVRRTPPPPPRARAHACARVHETPSTRGHGHAHAHAHAHRTLSTPQQCSDHGCGRCIKCIYIFLVLVFGSIFLLVNIVLGAGMMGTAVGLADMCAANPDTLVTGETGSVRWRWTDARLPSVSPSPGKPSPRS